MIQSLAELCADKIATIETEAVLQLMKSDTIPDCSLRGELQKKLSVRIITQIERIVEAKSFRQADGSIIARIVKMDELLVNVENLQGSLVKWSARAVLHPEILRPWK